MTHMKKNPNPPQHLSNFYNINNLKKYIQTKNLKNKKKLSIKIKEEVFLQERNLQKKRKLRKLNQTIQTKKTNCQDIYKKFLQTYFSLK